MLTEICKYLRNWFERDRWLDTFQISGGVLCYENGDPVEMLDGQYFRIIGSVFNDGVHQNGDSLTDEPEFKGSVWPMAVPPDFLALVSDIADWIKNNSAALNSPYSSESFGNYSYSLRGSGSTNGTDSGGVSWQSQFSSRLAPWRKI